MAPRHNHPNPCCSTTRFDAASIIASATGLGHLAPPGRLGEKSKWKKDTNAGIRPLHLLENGPPKLDTRPHHDHHYGNGSSPAGIIELTNQNSGAGFAHAA